MNKLKKVFAKSADDQLKLHFRRFEFKYAININQYLEIKKTIQKRMKVDPFAKNQGEYSIESIYFDTLSLSSYQQAKAGLKNRAKFRLRTYPDASRNKASKYVFWEIKRKKDATVLKDRSPLTLNQTLNILHDTSKRPKNDQTLNKFVFSLKRHLLKPKILIRYRREPFIADRNLRITFDKQIETGSVSSFWQKDIPTQLLLPQIVVMEIKFTGSLPFWLGQLVRQYDLERQPFSKYTQSIEITKPHLSWIIS